MDYTYSAGPVPFQCNICKKQFKSEGGFLLHYRTHKKPEKKKTGDASGSGCSHLFRLLVHGNKIEKKAIEYGLSVVCQKCGEVK